jgi:mannitol/fructose-specific phosphotransferase system IIA component (Ntr-type)
MANIFLPAASILPNMNRAMNKPGYLVLCDLISEATINLNLQSTDRDGVLHELVARIPAIANQPDAQQTLLRALHEREQLYSTGIGDGIALPHARNALVGLVDQPIIAFGRHSSGIDYGAIDGIPARLFFLLVAPTVTQHLAVLARISRLLRDQKLRQQLLTVDQPAKALAAIKEAEARL